MIRKVREHEWAVRDGYGIVRSVGRWREGEYHPGKLRHAAKEWWLLRKRESARVTRKEVREGG